jgi:hypothetical protein
MILSVDVFLIPTHQLREERLTSSTATTQLLAGADV